MNWTDYESTLAPPADDREARSRLSAGRNVSRLELTLGGAPFDLDEKVWAALAERLANFTHADWKAVKAGGADAVPELRPKASAPPKPKRTPPAPTEA